MEDHKKIVSDAIKTFLDTFSGADGGISFIRFRALMETLADQAEAGDSGSSDIIDSVAKVAALIKYANGG